MPEFGFTIINGQQVYDDPKSRKVYLDRIEDGQRGRETIRSTKKKTNPQVRYYWGLLLPEIRQQYMRDMVATVTVVPGVFRAGEPLKIERLVTNIETDVHPLVKQICSRVGDGGENLGLSEMDRFQASRYIDNVLWHAVNDLNMNGEALEAKRPNQKEEQDKQPGL